MMESQSEFFGSNASVPRDGEEAARLIRERASQLVDDVISQRGNATPPFSASEYACFLGVKKIVRTDLGKASGMLLRYVDGYVIKLNQNHAVSRQGFSCAHEVGHILFSDLGFERYIRTIEHRSPNPQLRVKVRAAARERLCDIAATELLMPEAVFRKYLSGDVSASSIAELARIFGVSIPAAAFRIAEVSTRPCVTLRWEPALKNGQAPLKLSGCVGPGLHFSNLGRCVPKENIVKHPSTLHDAYEQDSVVSSYRQFEHGGEDKRLRMESKGFGRGENRYVISLAFL